MGSHQRCAQQAWVMRLGKDIRDVLECIVQVLGHHGRTICIGRAMKLLEWDQAKFVRRDNEWPLLSLPM